MVQRDTQVIGGRPLPNALDVYEPLISQLVTKLGDDRHLMTLLAARDETDAQQVRNHKVRCQLLTVIRDTLAARSISVWHRKKVTADGMHDAWRSVAQSEGYGNAECDYFHQSVRSQVRDGDIFSSYSYGTYQVIDDLLYVFVPLKSKEYLEFMAIALPQDNLSLLAEPLGIILATMYQLDDRSLSSPDLAEGAILDALKAAFQFVSPKLYDRRYRLFQERLQRMIVHYQPIVHLDPFTITAWEALARDPEHNFSTPVDLFHAAELWGVQFTTELDLHFLKVATSTYHEQRSRFDRKRACDDMIPLAVNVYPASLMREVYFEAVRQVMSRPHGISPGKLILEISEKSALPTVPWETHGPDYEAFGKRLKQYLYHQIKVRFAIDDFGVGHASLSRLLGLKLDYVKIDPDVLRHSSAVTGRALQFVSEVLIEAGHYGSTVILEGVDDKCPVSLRDLKERGVSSVQGWLVDHATDRIYERLSQEQYETLRLHF
jgi:EAL domain-containing protein (putative c-di-GMP-specific phosphodiesterase class I)